MRSNDTAYTRIILDGKLKQVQVLVNRKAFQEAEQELSLAEEIFEQLESSLDFNKLVHRRILQNRRMDIGILYDKIQSGLVRREKGKREDGNIAFKCNWNDKGYKGVCSNSAFTYNLNHGRSWCSLGFCRSYVDIDPIPLECCYESRALLDCTFAAGWDHDDKGTFIRPRKIWSARKGKVALLTTEPPGKAERFIVAAFLIEKIIEDPGKETWIYGDKQTMLDDMLPYEIPFWQYHMNPNNPLSRAWSTGLFRYVSDVAILGMLEAYISKSSTADKRATAEKLISAVK